MRVFVTGGTGFVGTQIVRDLLSRGHAVRLLVRPGSERKVGEKAAVELAPGDLTDPRSLEGKLAGCDAVIHLVGIIKQYPHKGITFEKIHREATRHALQAARAQGVRRFLHMSSLGTRPGARSLYHQTKFEAETLVRESGLETTIFRPSVIFGARDQFVNLFAGMMRRSPIVPMIGGGRNRLQPVAVENVSQGFVRALERPEAVGRAFEVGGPESFTLSEILDAIARILGKRVLKLPVPIGVMKLQCLFLERFEFFPLSRDQLFMLQEDNVCDPRPFFDTFGIKPIPFEEGIASYLVMGSGLGF